MFKTQLHNFETAVARHREHPATSNGSARTVSFASQGSGTDPWKVARFGAERSRRSLMGRLVQGAA